MNHRQNQNILKDFLEKEKNYEVIMPEENKSLKDQKVDLIISDYIGFINNQGQIREMKSKANPIFMPVLILVSNEEKNHLTDDILEQIDEFINIPIKKQELEIRLKNLFKIRELSLESEKRYQTLSQNSSAGICIIQDGYVAYSNLSMAVIFNKNREKITDKPFMNLISDSGSDQIKQHQIKEIINNPSLLYEVEKPESFEFQIKTKKAVKWIEVSLFTIHYQGKLSILTIISDITEKKKQEEKMAHLSYHDTLTNLHNRAYLEEEIKRIDVEENFPLSVVVIDVNGLKLVNDTFGHQAGDNLLICVAKILTNACDDAGAIIRWGGDEFVLLFPNSDEKYVEKVTRKIKDAASKSIVETVPVRVAIGYAVKSTSSKPFDDVFKEAEDKMYKNKFEENDSVKKDIIQALLKNLRNKSDETEKHALRMTSISFHFGEELGLAEVELERLSLIATLHDIGKVVISESILKKPGKLTDEEWEKIKEHPEIGWRITRSTENLAHVAEEILSHHERWDGKGYPRGLKEKEIPYLSRIISIVDAYDVMTNDRSYKKAISNKEALNEISKCAGSQFDPELAKVFVKLMKKDEINIL
ncbi:Cyclic di-GMP phosphodiesterase response regulator RpfG [Natranaerofaba carboxydovora]|nr:Cyclic di-GMP phosphodiesterase response regulator RpfG [Natranaerofaba carboxydovora]